MRKKGALVDRLCVFGGAAAICSFCSRNNNKNADDQTKPLINNAITTTQQVKLKDLVIAPPTLAFHLKPKVIHFNSLSLSKYSFIHSFIILEGCFNLLYYMDFFFL